MPTHPALFVGPRAFPVNTRSSEMLYLLVLTQSKRKTADALLLDVL